MASACTNATTTVRSVRLFRIDGFSLVSSTMGHDECFKFRWDVDGYEWELHCFPSYFSAVWLKLMFLSDADATCNVRASLGYLLVHPGLDGLSQERRTSDVFKRPNDCTQQVYLVNKVDLPVPSRSSDDHLTVQCTITILKDLPEVTTSVPVPTSNLHLHFGELLRSGTGADVTFLVSGESFLAHKLILAARSPVLMAEFFGHMREASSPNVVIEDMEPAAFKVMLHFLYTDTVPELDHELQAVAPMAQHLLAAADRYGLDRLKVLCEGKLSGGITIDTAATTLALAEQHNCSHLKAKCIEFIISTPAVFDAVVATEGYRHLEASCPSALTSILLSMRGRRLKTNIFCENLARFMLAVFFPNIRDFCLYIQSIKGFSRIGKNHYMLIQQVARWILDLVGRLRRVALLLAF
uniref:Speckle-type POZ protein-like protein n=1 Tax=Aegilops tauschii TaxID=37682 RepID=M8BCI4_AEGTA